MKMLTKEQISELNQLATLADEEIDTTDIPEQTNWSDAVVGKFYSVTRQEHIDPAPLHKMER